MYIVYEGKHKLTDNPISLNWLYHIFASISLPNVVAYMMPGSSIAIDKYKIVKVD